MDGSECENTMNKRNINIFGKVFAGPRGLRLSPGTNSHAACVARELTGKKGGNPRERFYAASRKCGGKAQ